MVSIHSFMPVSLPEKRPSPRLLLQAASKGALRAYDTITCSKPAVTNRPLGPTAANLRVRPFRCTTSSWQLEHGAGRVHHKHFAVPDVAGEHGVGAVAGLRADFPTADTGLRRRRDEAGAQAVPAEALGIEAHPPSVELDDQGYALASHRRCLNPAALADPPEQRPGRDPRAVQPSPESLDRAGAGAREGYAYVPALGLLIGLASPQPQDQALGNEGHVLHSETGQFAPAQGRRKPDQQQGSVPDTVEVGRQSVDDRQQVLFEERIDLPLRGAMHPPDSP